MAWCALWNASAMVSFSSHVAHCSMSCGMGLPVQWYTASWLTVGDPIVVACTAQHSTAHDCSPCAFISLLSLRGLQWDYARIGLALPTCSTFQLSNCAVSSLIRDCAFICVQHQSYLKRMTDNEIQSDIGTMWHGIPGVAMCADM